MGTLVYYPQGISVSLSAGNTAGTLAQISSGTLYLAGGNNVTLSQNGNSVTFSAAGGTATGLSALAVSGGGGTSNAVTGLTFANANNVTFGLSTGASLGTMTASYAPPLGSRADLWPAGAWGSSTVTAQGSASIRYLQLAQPVTFSRVDIPVVISLATAATTATADLNISAGLVIYSQNASTLSPITGLLSTTTYTWASNTANYSNINGGRNMSFAVSGSLSAGEYWIGVQWSTTNNSSIGLSTTQLGNTIYIPLGIVDTGNQYGDFGATYSQSQNLSSQGVFSNTITASNQTLAMSNISATGAAYQVANFPVILRNY